MCWEYWHFPTTRNTFQWFGNVHHVDWDSVASETMSGNHLQVASADAGFFFERPLPMSVDNFIRYLQCHPFEDFAMQSKWLLGQLVVVPEASGNGSKKRIVETEEKEGKHETVIWQLKRKSEHMWGVVALHIK